LQPVPSSKRSTVGNKRWNRNTSAHIDAGLDQAVVEPLRVGKPDLWKRLIGIYMDTAPVSLETLERALANNDCPSIHMAAHTLKSSSAHMGAVKLADLCRQLEAAAGEGNLQAGPALLGALRDELDIVITSLARDGEDNALAGRHTA
ncbi:MAG: Hpt domain-containing protein, partial [Proteobacteria bacterium]|nr:Hpt domain-containing protein [Pseudomonadota bacterium]